jgi:hypothetical protein
MCLVREDSVAIWQAPRPEVYPYGWIIRVPHAAEHMWPGDGFEEKQLNMLIPRLPTLTSLRLKIHGSPPRTPSPVRPDGTLDPALKKAMENLPK